MLPDSTVNSGLPWATGISALGVLTTLSARCRAPANPSPANLPDAAVALNCSANFRSCKRLVDEAAAYRWPSAATGGHAAPEKGVCPDLRCIVKDTGFCGSLATAMMTRFEALAFQSGAAISLFRLSTYALWCLP